MQELRSSPYYSLKLLAKLLLYMKHSYAKCVRADKTLEEHLRDIAAMLRMGRDGVRKWVGAYTTFEEQKAVRARDGEIIRRGRLPRAQLSAGQAQSTERRG